MEKTPPSLKPRQRRPRQANRPLAPQTRTAVYKAINRERFDGCHKRAVRERGRGAGKAGAHVDVGEKLERSVP